MSPLVNPLGPVGATGAAGAAGATGAAGAAGPAGAAGANNLWRKDVNPFLGYTVNQGTWAFIVNSAQANSGYLNNAATLALNDSISYTLDLVPGTWDLYVVYATTASGAVITPTLNSTALASQDTYSSASAYNLIQHITGISVTTAGQQTLKFAATSRNASNTTGYGVRLSLFTFVRTA